MKKPLIEACVDSYESCEIACNNGADRLELCGNLMLGGTTPTRSLFMQVAKNFEIKINVLIRPRFGDFLYSENEMDQMCDDIMMFNELGANGVVIGCLTEDGRIDEEKMKRLIACAGEMEITLHRAFDMTRDSKEALEVAVSLGIDTILTSGQEQSALLGKELIKEINEIAFGKIDIMAGAGVSSQNIVQIHEYCGVTSFHTSGRNGVIKSEMRYRKKSVSMGLENISEYELWRTDAKEFKSCADIVHSIK